VDICHEADSWYENDGAGLMTGKDRSLTSLLNDSHIRGIFFQILMALGLLFFGSWLVDNTLTNLSNQGKTLGFDFFDSHGGFPNHSNTWYLDV